jgi:hypothetical protein
MVFNEVVTLHRMSAARWYVAGDRRVGMSGRGQVPLTIRGEKKGEVGGQERRGGERRGEKGGDGKRTGQSNTEKGMT